MKVPKAAVGIAKCPTTNKIYGVRIETDNEDWDNKFMNPICEIKICPYCGEMLE